jgi:hypothetical protein
VTSLEITNADSAQATNVLGCNYGKAYIHHNILHKDNAGSAGDVILGSVDADVLQLYRNIMYGAKDRSNVRRTDAVTNAYGFNNTVYYASSGASAWGWRIGAGAFTELKQNVSFANAAADYSLFLTSGTAQNASDDGTGDSPFASLTPANELTNPTTTWASTDLTIKDTNTTIYKAGSTIYSTVTYPEADVPISNRNITITGEWSLGADDIIKKYLYLRSLDYTIRTLLSWSQ